MQEKDKHINCRQSGSCLHNHMNLMKLLHGLMQPQKNHNGTIQYFAKQFIQILKFI